MQANEVADYIYDAFTAAELLARAADDLVGTSSDGRLALVAREWVAMRFERRDARGIGSGDRRAVEAFDATVRYATVDPADLNA